MAERRIKMVCTECGSDEVLADAYVQWGVEKQEWIVQNVFEKGDYCDSCDGEARYEAIELADHAEEEPCQD